MNTLLSRDNFRNGVFERDKHVCVICQAPAQDAHHILERRLFDDGGYYLNNGASLCGKCHILAEQTILSVEEIREACGIKKPVFPEHMYPDQVYDKWGNIINNNGTRIRGELFGDESVQKILKEGNVLDKFLPYVKYPRTFHLPFSYGRTDDDRALKDCSIFENQEVVISLKMDGENTTGYYDGYIHARSVDSRNHPSRNWVKGFLSAKLFDLPKGWRICGENLYAKHSIHYTDLSSYFLAFSIWDESNHCLSWKDTVEWCQLLDIHTVPILYQGVWDETVAREIAHTIETEKRDSWEGFVVRLADKFHYSQFSKSCAKMVRSNHVQTNTHWIKTEIVPNKLKEEE